MTLMLPQVRTTALENLELETSPAVSLSAEASTRTVEGKRT